MLDENKQTSMVTMIDPPSGWRYGFPKALPNGITDIRKWLIEQGYPEHDVDFASKNCRMWLTLDEEDTSNERVKSC